MSKKFKSIIICGILILTTIPTLISTDKINFVDEPIRDIKNQTVFQTEFFPDFPVMENFQIDLNPIEESSKIIPMDDFNELLKNQNNTIEVSGILKHKDR